MKIRPASSADPSARTIRQHLHHAAFQKGIPGEDLVIEVVQLGLLKEDLVAEGKSDDPTVAMYAERFGRTTEQAPADLGEFVDAVGVEPLFFWELEEEVLASGSRPLVGHTPPDGIYIVAAA
jgi:hypothetical protein